MSQEDYYTRSRKPVIPMPETRLEKIGCGAALVVWFSILLLPCAMFWLASGGALVIPSGLPESRSHPALEVRLIAESDYTGLQVTRSTVSNSAENDLCVYTGVNYLLWTNRTGDNQNVAYCDCYSRENADAAWTLTETIPNGCEG